MASDSRSADKFVVRLPDGMRASVEDQAGDQHTSMNTFIVQAIGEKLDRGRRQDMLLASLQRELDRLKRLGISPEVAA